MRPRTIFRTVAAIAALSAALPAAAVAEEGPDPLEHTGIGKTGIISDLLGGGSPAATQPATVGNFSYGQLGSATVGDSGCGTNAAGEPAIHVSRDDETFLSSELGLGGGTLVWRGSGTASPCLEYRGQPDAASGIGASGGDTDLAIASAPNALGNFNVYVASLNLGSVSVSVSQDNGTTFANTPVVAGLPVDDREWIAAFGAGTALLSYHDIGTNNIDVLRSDDGGRTYTQTARAIPDSDYKAANNELGNLVIDHDNLPAGGGFWAYQSFVAPSSSSGSHFNEAFVAVSSDGGHTFTDKPVPCSTAGADTDLDHNFPNVSVAPNGDLWYAWSDDVNVSTAVSHDHGDTWTCNGPASTNTAQAIFPWLVATDGGVDLVYYGTPTKTNQTWSVYFAQDLGSGFGTPEQLMPVHTGTVCEGGVSCTGGRQLLDDFGVDTDSSGFAHIAYSHDAPDLGGSGSFTGSAVQTGGTPVGAPNR